MGFWGTFVLTRSAELLASSEAVLGFGYQHETLYELGGQWQLLETRGVLPPVGLDRASEQYIAATAAAVLAARVYNSDCLMVHAQTPQGWSSLVHLPGPAAECPHRHTEPPAPRPADSIAADLAHWATAAGLTPASEKIRTLVRQTAGGWFANEAHEVLQALLPALGLAEAAKPHPTVIDVDELPYCAIVGFSGIARQAWNRAVTRAHPRSGKGPFGPEQPWEAAAIRFEAELWAARFRTDTDTVALRQRAEQICVAYQAAEDAPLLRWRT